MVEIGSKWGEADLQTPVEEGAYIEAEAGITGIKACLKMKKTRTRTVMTIRVGLYAKSCRKKVLINQKAWPSRGVRTSKLNVRAAAKSQPTQSILATCHIALTRSSSRKPSKNSVKLCMPVWPWTKRVYPPGMASSSFRQKKLPKMRQELWTKLTLTREKFPARSISEPWKNAISIKFKLNYFYGQLLR